MFSFDFKHVLRPLAALLLCLFLTGCHSFKPEPKPPQYLIIEGKGAPDPAAVADRVPWAMAFAGTIKAEATAKIDPPIASAPGIAAPDVLPSPAGEETLLTMAASRRAALRALGQRIGALPDGQKNPISQSIDQKPELASALGRMLESDAQTTTTRLDPQTVGVAAAIDGQGVLDLLKKYGVPFTFGVADLPAAQQNDLKQQAYNKAIDDARDRLKKGILALKEKNGKPLAAIFADHPERMREIDSMLFLQQADETKYADDGSCTVQILFDANRARAVAHPPAPWYAPWRS